MTPRRVLTVAGAAALLCAGCGSSSSSSSNSSSGAAGPPPASASADISPPGDIPDNQAYVRVKPRGATFSVTVPEGWSQSTSSGAVAFTDKLNTVRIEETGAGAAPSVAAVRSTVVPRLARTARDFRLQTVTTVHRKAGDAVRVRYLARSPADPVTGRTRRDAVERYAFFHGGREAVLTLSGPDGADNVDPWRIITDSLRWGR